MKIQLAILALLTFTTARSQQPKPAVSDTSFVLGMVKEDTYIGKQITAWCSNGIDKKLETGTAVLISGAQRCQGYSTPKEYYEIVINKNIYYIKNNSK